MTATFYAKLLLVSQTLLPALPAAMRQPAPTAGEAAPAAAVPLSALAGQVSNEVGAPLPGVIVAVQGSPTTASTNADGRFLLTAPVDEPVLVFKCAGYRVQTVVASSGPLAVTMYALTGTGSDKTTATVGAASAATTLIIAEVMPTFTGGMKAYSAYLRQNAQYPAQALEQHLGGVVYISFVVDEQGRICDAEVLKGCGHGFDEEALRLVRLMPWWQPGQMAGKPVRVAHSLRIAFEARQ